LGLLALDGTLLKPWITPAAQRLEVKPPVRRVMLPRRLDEAQHLVVMDQLPYDQAQGVATVAGGMAERLAVAPDDQVVLVGGAIPGLGLAMVPILRGVDLVGEGAEHQPAGRWQH
jgi:hypothetical protein